MLPEKKDDSMPVDTCNAMTERMVVDRATALPKGSSPYSRLQPTCNCRKTTIAGTSPNAFNALLLTSIHCITLVEVVLI